MYILNETELITNPYECDKSTTKTLDIKLEHHYDNYNNFVFNQLEFKKENMKYID